MSELELGPKSRNFVRGASSWIQDEDGLSIAPNMADLSHRNAQCFGRYAEIQETS
jgi:hypothetical protein